MGSDQLKVHVILDFYAENMIANIAKHDFAVTAFCNLLSRQLA